MARTVMIRGRKMKVKTAKSKKRTTKKSKKAKKATKRKTKKSKKSRGKARGSGLKSLVSKASQKAFKTMQNIHRARDPKARQLLDGEWHIPLHGFTGPGTRTDLEWVRNFPPYNAVDAASRTHDLAYGDALKIKDEGARLAAFRDADERFMTTVRALPDMYGKKAALAGIGTKMQMENIAPGAAKRVFTEYRGMKPPKAGQGFSLGSFIDRQVGKAKLRAAPVAANMLAETLEDLAAEARATQAKKGGRLTQKDLDSFALRAIKALAKDTAKDTAKIAVPVAVAGVAAHKIRKKIKSRKRK